jgi:surfeit locus 1 family protein
MHRFVFPLLLGIGGVAVLVWLGVWQMQRLAWKEGVLAGIEAQLTAEPVALPAPGAAGGDLNYRSVAVTGATTGDEVLVLSGRKDVGAGYRVISGFRTDDGRLVMLDRGFIAEEARRTPRPAVPLEVTGNLIWPRDANSSTPPPDMKERLWFARDVATMAQALGTEPLLIVVRRQTGDAQGVDPEPVDTSGIPNDHFGYALTWFSLAVVWAGMIGLLLWRIRRRPT